MQSSRMRKPWLRLVENITPSSPSLHSSQRRRSLRSAQRTLLETPSSRRLSSQTKTTARQCSYGANAIGKWSHVQASRHLEEQTPRTLLKNILLTAPESSVVMPESVVKPEPAPQLVQPSRQESSRGSLELQLPELEPPITLAPGLLALGRRKQKLRLSVFQQGMDQELALSQEPRGNADASSLTSSLNLTFATPLQPQSVQRPGLARKPPSRRPVDVGAFLQDLQDTSLALAPLGDSHRTPVATLPTDTVLEDTQPFSHPLVGRSPSVHHSLPCPSHIGAADAERAVGHRTRSSGPKLQNNSLGKPAQPLVERAEEVNALDMGFPNINSSVSGEGGVKPLEDRVGEEAEERMEEGLSISEMKEATGVQRSAKAEEHEGHTEVQEAEGSQGAIEAMEPEGSSGDEDTSGGTATPELASNTPEFLQARRLHQFLEPTPPPSAADLCSEPLGPLSARLPPRARTIGPRPHKDPYKAGLSHYVKLFSFCAKMPMEKKTLEMVEKCMDKYFQHLCDDLEVFAAHAGRKTVKPEDLELLMRRQGLVTDQVSLYVLVERHLPLEYRQLLIPCAFSGNSVFPAR
ncbi:centromere protein T isoform X2 [Dasypus novemcinctus]|uniref:centromere protein T isoform X2 n=2 Tax=Dasypus novemcinctus TaxID=9361 RepID=UPI000C857AE9|nr:centromere protein T isoform X2 [Dasypus novemcinctus]XP_058135817.1 centromere protein T isoform X2 [Dasypus novemcinctus]